MGEAAFIGVPLDLGKDHGGTDKAPDVLRTKGILNILEQAGLSVSDLGDIKCPKRDQVEMGDKNVKYLEPILKITNDIAEKVEGEIRNGKKIVAVGGDNTVSIGTISGASAALSGELGIIWIDAHGDINTHETTLSGNVHGMPISAVLGLGHPDLANVYKKGAKIKPENILYIGVKDLDQAEIDLIRKLKIPSITMLEVLENGLKPVFEKIAELKNRAGNIWVCLDVDSIDKDYAPGTPMATSGGLTARESLGIAKFIGKTCSVVGIDVTEFAPDLDVSNKTSDLVLELITNYLGVESNWYTRYMDEESRKQALRSINNDSVIDSRV